MKASKFFIIGIAAMAFFFIPSGGETLHDSGAVSEAVPKTLPPPVIEAKAARARDLLNGETLFSKNSGDILPLASLTKVVSLLVILELADLYEEVIVSQSAVLTPEPSSLVVGEKLQVVDLATMAMVESSNDAVAALVEYVADKNGVAQELSKDWFLNLMRQKVEAFGINEMMLFDFTGLDIDDNFAGAYGTAEDVLKITGQSRNSILWQLGDIREVVSQEGIVHTLKPTNTLYQELSSLIGAKTGFTDIAGGNLLVIVEYPLGNPVGIVVLGSSEEGRFEDVKKILDWIKTTR